MTRKDAAQAILTIVGLVIAGAIWYAYVLPLING